MEGAVEDIEIYFCINAIDNALFGELPELPVVGRGRLEYIVIIGKPKGITFKLATQKVLIVVIIGVDDGLLTVVIFYNIAPFLEVGNELFF